MKKVIVFLFLSLLLSCNSGKRKPQGESEFQRKMNTKFKDASTSPLTKSGLRKFKGLTFFPINEKFKVSAKLTKTPNGKVFNFPTTTSETVKYKKYGVIQFSIDEKDFELDIYKDPNPRIDYKNHLFLPFLDETNGKGSYGGGRFIDVLTTDIKEDGTVTIDFNTAYNPYCAYNKLYSCPITPRNNSLAIAIEAGVMDYKK